MAGEEEAGVLVTERVGGGGLAEGHAPAERARCIRVGAWKEEARREGRWSASLG
jgi:hypothetical protein